MDTLGCLVLRLNQASLDYLQRLTGAAPIEFIREPFIWLTDPRVGISQSDAHGVLGLNSLFRFSRTESLLSPASGLPEFCVIGHPDPELGKAFPQAAETFSPYFVWAVDVHRNSRARNFAIAVTNSMHADSIPLIGNILFMGDDTAEFSTFNVHTQDTERLVP